MDDTCKIPPNNFKPDITQNQFCISILEFVRDQLAAWRDHPDRAEMFAEEELSSQLCDYLNSDTCRASFPMVSFKYEERQYKRRRVDMAAKPVKPIIIEARRYTIFEPIIVIECKRLPTTSDREKEYVTGYDKLNGGIQRFKLGLHGKKHRLVGLIGYIQQRNPQEWHSTINYWINELSNNNSDSSCKWDKAEVLDEIEENDNTGIASCHSIHPRLNGDTPYIIIHHLWVVMDKQN
jgi:hypothetical protein